MFCFLFIYIFSSQLSQNVVEVHEIRACFILSLGGSIEKDSREAKKNCDTHLILPGATELARQNAGLKEESEFSVFSVTPLLNTE